MASPVTSIVIRGGELLEGAEAGKQLKKRLAHDIKCVGASFEVAQGVPLSKVQKRTHFLIKIATGSGKSQFLFKLLQHFEKHREKTIVLAVKGDHIAKLAAHENSPTPLL